MAPGHLHRDRDPGQRSRRADCPRDADDPPHAVATATLGALAALFAASWAILVAGGDWASWALVVTFPIALRIGFVFLGGQAGRLLDVRQMKELLRRVVSGFAVGFLVGGVIQIPLLALLGSTENLLLAATAAQLAFLGLLLFTEHRFPEVRAERAVGAPVVARPPLRKLFTGLLALLLAYQVLSAMGSQVVDFLLFDRAAARYSSEDLTRFLSLYTALLNLVDIVFLAVLAGPLMRRFGLRLGLTLNPATVAVILAAMALAAAGAGVASFGVFVLAGLLRIADLTTTDGTTRTSINAAYQVVPADERLAVQTVVEGVGVPVAIGATGVLLLVFDALEFGVGAVIAFGLLLSVLWTAVAVGVFGSYRHALVDARAAVTARSLVCDLARSSVVADRRGATAILAERGLAADRDVLPALLDDPEPSVRLAALDAVAAADAAEPGIVQRVVAAAGEARTAGRATAAMAQLGDAAVPPLVAALAPRMRAGAYASYAPRRRPPPTTASRSFSPALGDPDRSVVLAALVALAAAGVDGTVAPEVLDNVFDDAGVLAARAFSARSALGDQDGPLVRALDDEIQLARRLIIAVLALRHGDRIRVAVRVVEHGEGARRALAVEALDVVLSRAEAAVAVPLVCHSEAPDTPGASCDAAARPRARGRNGSRRSHLTRKSGARRGSRHARRSRSRDSASDQPASGSVARRRRVETRYRTAPTAM